MRSVAFVIVLVALAASAPSYREEEWGSELIEELPQEDLMQVVNHLRGLVKDKKLKHHANLISDHAVLIQKARAYGHDFSASKAAIAAALKSLNKQLEEGHSHDVEALKQGKSDNEKMIEKGQNNGKVKTHGYRNKACPTKRAEEEADSKKKAAKQVMDEIRKGKICGKIGAATWGDMDVEKASPKFGMVIRNEWDKTHATYAEAKIKFDVAVKKHRAALEKHNVAMAAFKTALDMEVANADNVCKNAHKEYAALQSEVAHNVMARKQVYTATLVVQCYVDNLSNNAGAKKCADGARDADTSKFNIDGGKLAACPSRSHLTNVMGPEGWKATVANCNKEAELQLNFESY